MWLAHPQTTNNAIWNENRNIVNVVSSSKKAIKEGEWIYYCGLPDDNLYKMKLDGANTVKLSSDKVYGIDIWDNWIFYLNRSDKYIYKISTDGTNRTKIGKSRCLEAELKDDYLYFVKSDDKKIYRIKADGTSETNLGNNKAFRMKLLGNNIYYLNDDDEDKIYKMNLDGSGNQKLTEDNVVVYNISSDLIYYNSFNSGETSKLIKIDLDGSNKTELYERLSFNPVEIQYDSVYFICNPAVDGGICKIKTDGSINALITNQPIGEILFILDDWIYATRYIGEVSQNKTELIKMKTDGSNITRIQ